MNQDFSETLMKEIPLAEFFELLQGNHKEEINRVSKVYWFRDCRVTEIQTKDGYKYFKQMYIGENGNGKDKKEDRA